MIAIYSKLSLTQKEHRRKNLENLEKIIDNDIKIEVTYQELFGPIINGSPGFTIRLTVFKKVN